MPRPRHESESAGMERETAAYRPLFEVLVPPPPPTRLPTPRATGTAREMAYRPLLEVLVGATGTERETTKPRTPRTARFSRSSS